MKGWKFWNPVTKKPLISNDAEFDEQLFLGSRTFLNDSLMPDEDYVDVPVFPTATSERPMQMDDVDHDSPCISDPLEPPIAPLHRSSCLRNLVHPVHAPGPSPDVTDACGIGV